MGENCQAAVGDRDGAVLCEHEAASGDGARADRGGKVCEGRVALGIGVEWTFQGRVQPCGAMCSSSLARRMASLQRAREMGARAVTGTKTVALEEPPGRAVLRQPTARDNVVDVGVVLELSAPGVQDPGAPREVGADEPLVCGEACEGERRGVEHGVVREALMGADEGAQGLGDREGEEQVRPGELLLQVGVEPRRGCMLRALGTVPVATGMLDAVVLATAVALREAMSIVAALAVLDGAEDLSVGGGEMGGALQGLWCAGSEDVTQGRHGRHPCMRALRRS